MNENKVILENLVAVVNFQYDYKPEARPITALQTPDCDWSLFWYIEGNFSKLTDSNQIFMSDFVCFLYHICEIWTQIIEWIILSLKR